MKSTPYLLLLSLWLLSCQEKTVETTAPVAIDTLQVSPQRKWETFDSIASSSGLGPVDMAETSTENEEITELDSLFGNLELKEITKKDFENYERLYNKDAKPLSDAKGHFKNVGLSLESNCDEICEAYLVEIESGKKMLLPSNFDAGILGIAFSPAATRLILYSSYDGPDYGDYYAYRSEIIAYTIGKEKGLKAIQPHFDYQSKDWSIERLTWIDENTIALKMYNEARWGDGSGVHYHYFKTSIK